MLALMTPDAEQAERWLRQAGVRHYICDQCHGIHISELQSRDGVLDSRLFVEHQSILFSTELEIRPGALFSVMAELAQLNMSWPSLKLFVDLSDDSLPRLVCCQTLLTRHGVTFDQFFHFVQSSSEAMFQVLDQCAMAHWLFRDDEGEDFASGDAACGQDALH